MSRNIKEIGKELLGKSLNSYHRKTGLTQLEENNKMQDGILDGILSQVDDSYIEKTEQSNVIHLDGSGDGVVVLDSIEGNTMVNLWKGVASLSTNWIQGDLTQEITNKILTVCNLTDKRIFFELSTIDGSNGGYSRGIHVESNSKLKIIVTSNEKKRMVQGRFSDGWLETEIDKFKKGVLVIEGDYTNKEIPPYFEGLQSSFEEQVENDKYKIEILSNNGNLFNMDKWKKGLSVTRGSISFNGNSFTLSSNASDCHTGIVSSGVVPDEVKHRLIRIKEGSSYRVGFSKNNTEQAIIYYGWYDANYNTISFHNYYVTSLSDSRIIQSPKNAKYFMYRFGIVLENKSITFSNVFFGNTSLTSYIEPKFNKIKLLINEPLRGLPSGVKDRLFVIENKLMIERNCSKIVFDGTNNIWQRQPALDNATKERYCTSRIENVKLFETVLCNTLPSAKGGNQEVTNIYIHNTENRFDIQKLKTDNRWTDVNSLNNWFKNNPTVVIYPLAEPYYEEVLNEYGEPILLEGYENGTIYIDSTIVPTTTVRYTPKMQSFKTLKEVNDNNTMLTNDINDNIIPYLMDVDLMIMEKEMALMSHKNIRTIGVKDMTSMQKRTQDMLERLIKGKTLTEQECKTRITTYLNAGKITDAQAEELNFLIDEIYA